MSNLLTIIPSANEKALTLAEKAREDTLRINKIFYSIQGESSRAGERSIFIRMTGCGLRCSYCDTEYAFFEGVDRSIESILSEIKKFDCKLVELTGGEPLEQQGVYSLIAVLLERGYDLMIETGGHVDISRLDPQVKRIVDVKTPSSGMSKRNLLSNLKIVTIHDEIKLVIGDRTDYYWARDIIRQYDLTNRVGTVLLSPVHGSLQESDLAAWILEDALDVRFQIQLHKVIWPAAMRGV